MKWIDIIAKILAIIAMLNVGFIGMFRKNFLEMWISNDMAIRVIYTIMGVAAIWLIYKMIKEAMD